MIHSRKSVANLVVAAAAGVQLARHGPQAFGQKALDRGVDVLVGRCRVEGPLVDLGLDVGQAALNGFGLAGPMLCRRHRAQLPRQSLSRQSVTSLEAYPSTHSGNRIDDQAKSPSTRESVRATGHRLHATPLTQLDPEYGDTGF